MISLAAGQSKISFLQDRIAAVPHSDGKTDHSVSVRNTGDAIFIPTVRLRPCQVVRKVIPGSPISAIVLTDRSPGALAKVWAPPFPMRFHFTAFTQSYLFGSFSHRNLQLVFSVE